MAQEFYLDFRQRLMGLVAEPSPGSVEEVITNRGVETSPSPESPSPRYLYADKQGQLQFADSMEDIPPEFRKDAQRMDE